MPDPEKTTKPACRSVTFLRRLISSIILWTLVIGALFSGHEILSDYVFWIIMLLLSGFGLAEFYGLVAQRNMACFRGWGILAGFLLLTSTFFYSSGRWLEYASPAMTNDFENVILIIFVLGLCIRQFVSKSNTAGMLAISTTLFGLMYVPWLLNFIQKINFYPGIQGSFYVLYFVLVTKFSDLGAYSIGSLVGRHKMIPRISPGKTWEGFGGAIVVATLASVVFASFAGDNLAGMNLLHAVVLGILLSIAAVVGDLIESIFKREAGVKDSGRLFPGIGGILDLIDSLLFNAPIMYLYMRHVIGV